MIKVKPLILESFKRRSVELSTSPLMISKLINSKYKTAKQLYDAGCIFYRGLKSAGAPYYSIDPTKTIRMPDQQSKFAHFLFDILPSWKKWPKRSKSLIFINSANAASTYGYNTYFVFPRDGAEIAVCPSTDFWFSFSHLDRRLNIDGIPNFNRFFSKFLFTVYDTESENFNDSNEVKSILEFLNKKAPSAEILRNQIKEVLGYSAYGYLLEDMGDNFKGDWLEYFDGLLDPETNGFKLVAIENINSEEFSKEYNTYEMFTESKCILIKTNL